MRDTGHLKNHMSLSVAIEGLEISRTPMEDPFHTTRVVLDLADLTLWERVKSVFRPRTIEVVVKVRADGCALGRWFQGADICEKCCRTRISGHEHKPGYQSHGMCVCEDCYYGKWPQQEHVGFVAGEETP